MVRFRIIAVLVLCSLFHLWGKAEVWRTHFAYNNVTQIALTPNLVYAVSDGSLYSVEKQSEHIQVYNRQSGLHETGITCIHYDAVGSQLIIAYGNGKIDILGANGVRYIGELYEKDMTQRKTIYNVTLKGRKAYLSTHYGIQTLDLREYKLVDSYWLLPGGLEKPVKDVKLTNDSIYAFTDDLLYCASLSDPLSDYHYWKSEPLGRVSRDTDKGVHYHDGTDDWYAGTSEGIIRVTPTGRLTYKPQGPLVNTPYQMSAYNGMLYIVPGGRWDVQYRRAACLMRYDGTSWMNIPQSAIHTTTGVAATDFMNIAIDPNDRYHCYVTAYGTGVYEFRNNAQLNYFIAGGGNNSLITTSTNPASYTRTDCGVYDQDGRAWIAQAGDIGSVHCIDQDGVWHAIPLEDSQENAALYTPSGLIIDWRNQYKWVASARYNTFLLLLDDKGTYDTADDRIKTRKEWTRQDGQAFQPEYIYATLQDRKGNVWICTEQGAAYIAARTDFFQSDAIVQPDIIENGEAILSTQQITSIVQDKLGQIWLGTLNMGVYVLNEGATEITAHYTSDNTAMPSNGILSMAYDIQTDRVYIGTSDGLVEYDPQGSESGSKNSDDAIEDDLLPGRILQWTPHPSYYDPQEIVLTKDAVFVKADGSLFSVDRTEGSISYWNKSTGLSGSTVAHIAYDQHVGKLIIAYENGQIDLLNDKGEITPMPDVAMKAGSMAVTINGIGIGQSHSYLAMDFGILVLNTKKAEISDTYYIGDEASAIAIQHVIETADSLYAFSFDRLYKASLKDNLVDYTYWQHDTIPCEVVKQVAVHKGAIYALFADSLLYRREGIDWKQVLPDKLNWIHSSNGLLLCYQQEGYVFAQLTEDNRLQLIDSNYQLRDAVYVDGQYWSGVPERGLYLLWNGVRYYYKPDGPMSNFGYRLYTAHDQLYVAPGGRWDVQYNRIGNLSVYNGLNWQHLPRWETLAKTGHDMRDAVSYAVDPTDGGHFFVTTYGTGVYEFKDYKAVQHYDSENSTLRQTSPNADVLRYTRTDGTLIDEQGNLWVLNATSIGSPVNIRTPNGQWRGLTLYSQGQRLELTTPGEILVDRRSSQRKWFSDQQFSTGVILLDDGGTPLNASDDRCLKRNTFIDQNGTLLTPTTIRCMAQDNKNRLWIGTDKGILIIPEEVDFFTSNLCNRIIIPRNDGTGLGDYLLGDEQINCIAVDGGNRIWIGTNSSGLYLMEDDTITVAHFTETNSMLPSNSVQSVAIMPKTGEIFAGTDRGIASYMSDASEAQEDMSGAYAFPNPVRPDYGGYISITGLMENSEVNIVDAGGNLVCKTRSNGGTAIWDGKDAYGRRAKAGVYTALCNAVGGHAAIKILFVRR